MYVFGPFLIANAGFVTGSLPKLFSHVRNIGCKHQNKRFPSFSGQVVQLVELVYINHHLAYGSVEVQSVCVFSDFLDGFVQSLDKLLRSLVF